MNNYYIAIPGELEEIPINDCSYNSMRKAIKDHIPKNEITIQQERNENGPVFTRDISLFTVFSNKKFITYGELIKR